MKTELARYRLGMLTVTLSAVAWSTAGLFTRAIHLDQWTLLAWRGLFGACGIAAIMVLLNRELKIRNFLRLGWPGLVYCIISAVGMMLFIASLRRTTVAHVSVIYATVPFVAAGLARWALDERVGARALLACTAALGGVALMVGFSTDGSLFGDLMAFGMTLCMAIMMIVSRKFPSIPTMPAACLSALLSGAACWPFGQPLAISGHEVFLLVLFGIVNSAVGLALFTIGARMIPAVETALIGSLDAPLAPVWVWLAFGETPTFATFVGGSIVFLAVAAYLLTGTLQDSR